MKKRINIESKWPIYFLRNVKDSYALAEHSIKSDHVIEVNGAKSVALEKNHFKRTSEYSWLKCYI